LNGNAQNTKIPNIDLSSLLTPAKTSQTSPLSHLVSKSEPKTKHSGFKQESSILEQLNGSNSLAALKSLTIPAFSELQDLSDIQEQDVIDGLSAKSKKIKKSNMCGHPERGHYAKNMCNPCYHKHGRTKKPWRCSHEKLYAHGLCQNCYINAYNKKRNDKVVKDKKDTNSFEVDTDIPTSINSNDEPLTMEDKVAFGEDDLEVPPNKIQIENSQN